MEESVWYKKLELQVNLELEKIYKRDVKFYQVDRFLKMAKKVDELSSFCTHCSELKLNAEYVSANLSELLKGDIRSRKLYERKLEEISRHLRKGHQIFPKQYFSYLFSFLGIVAGFLTGYLSMKIINPGALKEGIVLGTVIGLVIGRIIGKYHDKRLIQEGKNI